MGHGAAMGGHGVNHGGHGVKPWGQGSSHGVSQAMGSAP